MVIAQRRTGSLLGLVIAALVIAALVVVGIVVFAGDDDSSAAKKDVSVQACAADPGKPTARGQVVNHSSKTSNYLIRLKFADPQGNQVSEGVTAVNDVAPNETAAWELTGTRDANGPMSCEVTGATRTHIPGQ